MGGEDTFLVGGGSEVAAADAAWRGVVLLAGHWGPDVFCADASILPRSVAVRPTGCLNSDHSSAIAISPSFCLRVIMRAWAYPFQASWGSLLLTLFSLLLMLGCHGCLVEVLRGEGAATFCLHGVCASNFVE